MKIRKCQLCSSTSIRELRRIVRKKYSFTVDRCDNCGLVFMNPRPTQKQVMQMYDEDYFHGRGFDEGVNYIEGMKSSEAWETIYRNRLNTVQRHSRKGKILDLGCGIADFLRYAKSKGWDVQGVEISKFSADYSRKRLHVKVFMGTLEQAKFKDSSFDAITMVEVIEHLPNPMDTLRYCYKALKPGGVIVIQTGNIDGLYSRMKGSSWPYYLAGHLTYFSKKTIRRALEDAGFRVAKIYSGDEISFSSFSGMFWHDRKKSKFINWYGYLKSSIIYIARKLGVGGMTVYANKD